MARYSYIRWLEKEDLYCVNRFIENYFEQLIKIGQPISSKDMNLEVDLYIKQFNNKRTKDSVRLKFHNIEHLAFKFVEQNGNPYNIEILERLKGKSKQSLKAWKTQTEKYSENINKWLNIS